MHTHKLPLTKATLRSLNLCWRGPTLEAALALWPADTVTWRWFLGAHLGGMLRKEAALRLLVALRAARRANIRLPFVHARLAWWMARATLAEWLAAVRLLAAYLDAAPDDEAEAYAALAAHLRTRPRATPADEYEVIPDSAECAA